MKDIREIRAMLWHSMDMAFVKLLMFWTFLFTVIVSVTMLLSSRGMDTHERVAVIGIIMATAIAPILIVCAWRTFRTFQAAESYTFCKAKLSNPMGGRFRDSIKFRVLLEDADGYRFVADTHSIFQTHVGFGGFALEDYVNQEVTVAYNEETGNVVVIG